MPTRKLTPEVLQAAIEGFEAQKRHIDAQIAELRQALAGETGAAPEPAPPRKRRFSAAARRRMREAQQRRWAKARGEAVAA